jgi:allantoin racemase
MKTISDCHFQLSYVDTKFKELNTEEDAAQVIPLVLQNIVEAERAGASAVIVYAFGDVGVKEGKYLVSIPVMGLGKAATHMASLLCRNRYTIIPGQLAHNSFIAALVAEENLEHNFILASHAIHMNPAELKGNPLTLKRLIEAASAEIIEKNIDTFTLACGGFIGVAKPLEHELRKLHDKPIIVIDPVDVPFKVAMAL